MQSRTLHSLPISLFVTIQFFLLFFLSLSTYIPSTAASIPFSELGTDYVIVKLTDRLSTHFAVVDFTFTDDLEEQTRRNRAQLSPFSFSSPSQYRQASNFFRHPSDVVAAHILHGPWNVECFLVEDGSFKEAKDMRVRVNEPLDLEYWPFRGVRGVTCRSRRI